MFGAMPRNQRRYVSKNNGWMTAEN